MSKAALHLQLVTTSHDQSQEGHSPSPRLAERLQGHQQVQAPRPDPPARLIRDALPEELTPAPTQSPAPTIQESQQHRSNNLLCPINLRDSEESQLAACPSKANINSSQHQTPPPPIIKRGTNTFSWFQLPIMMHSGKTDSINNSRLQLSKHLQCITLACSAQVHSLANSPQASGQSQLAKK